MNPNGYSLGVRVKCLNFDGGSEQPCTETETEDPHRHDRKFVVLLAKPYTFPYCFINMPFQHVYKHKHCLFFQFAD